MQIFIIFSQAGVGETKFAESTPKLTTQTPLSSTLNSHRNWGTSLYTFQESTHMHFHWRFCDILQLTWIIHLKQKKNVPSKFHQRMITQRVKAHQLGGAAVSLRPHSHKQIGLLRLQGRSQQMLWHFVVVMCRFELTLILPWTLQESLSIQK